MGPSFYGQTGCRLRPRILEDMCFALNLFNSGNIFAESDGQLHH